MVINNDGIELVKQIKHISVYPVGGTMSDWVNAGPSSILTQAAKSVIIKWEVLVEWLILII